MYIFNEIDTNRDKKIDLKEVGEFLYNNVPCGHINE